MPLMTVTALNSLKLENMYEKNKMAAFLD